LKTTSIAFTLALVAALAAPVMAREQQITVYAKNFAFTPGTITLKVHQRAKLVFVGKQGTHGITIPDIGLNNIITIGSKPTTVKVTPQRTGSFIARCAVYCGIGHGTMLLKVNVIK
jgi:cytochrome c oxidase subunit 2